MPILLPRLPGPAAEILLESHLDSGFEAWPGFDPSNLPTAVRYTATGGSRISPSQLAELRDRILKIARNNGLGNKNGKALHPKFDSDMAVSLSEDPLFASGEALRDDVWTFIGVSLAPDITYWRFGTARKRYFGGIRNTFQRLWMRGRAFDRGANAPKRWQLLEELTEDALVQITERPSLGGDPVLACAIGEAWVRASQQYGRSAMEPIMRRTALQIRIWNEIRSLADLPPEQLVDLLDEAFSTFAEPKEEQKSTTVRFPNRTVGSNMQHVSERNANQPHAEKSDGIRDSQQAAIRIFDVAKQRGWISRKSSAALNNLSKGDRELNPRQLNALNFLLERFRSAAVLPEEVSLLTETLVSIDPS